MSGEIRGAEPHLRLASALSANTVGRADALTRVGRANTKPGATFSPAAEVMNPFTRAVKRVAHQSSGTFDEALPSMVREAAPHLPRAVTDQIAQDIKSDPRLAVVLEQAERTFARSRMTTV